VVLSADIRREKLSKLRNTGEVQGRQKLYYKGETQLLSVFRIDLDLLIYNRHNGRLEAEMLTWEQENFAPPDIYNDELHQLLEKLLWESNSPRNKQTLLDLEDKGQQRPGIVSLDGVVIDGNRRAMLLRKLEAKTKTKQYLDAIILPDSYADNQAEIVRLETQYQLGEDAKVEYGPLQKYLHARRLHVDLGIPMEEIDKLMGERTGNTKKLLGTMDLMDDYLQHIGCPRLYTMLKDTDGTKEGMFVDLYSDLSRLNNGKVKIPWAFDPDVDPLQLRLIQFDYIRLGVFADAKKVYREISHQGKGRNFFARKEIWEKFRGSHTTEVDPITAQMGSLEDFIKEHDGKFDSKVDAARRRDKEWSSKAKPHMDANFGQAHYKLELATAELKPGDYLKRARDLLEKIDVDSPALLASGENRELVHEINRMTYEIKKKFDRSGAF
jgi:hypothetical protein